MSCRFSLVKLETSDAKDLTSTQPKSNITKGAVSNMLLESVQVHFSPAALPETHAIVGILNSAPARMPVGQRVVTAFCLV